MYRPMQAWYKLYAWEVIIHLTAVKAHYPIHLLQLEAVAEEVVPVRGG